MQQDAQKLAPIIRGQQFEDSQKLLNLGSVLEDQQARQLQEDIMRDQVRYTEPRERLENQLAFVTGATRGGTSTTSSPIYGSSQSNFLNPLGAFNILGGFKGLFG